MYEEKVQILVRPQLSAPFAEVETKARALSSEIFEKTGLEGQSSQYSIIYETEAKCENEKAFADHLKEQKAKGN